MALIVIVDDLATNRAIYSKLAQSIGEGVKVRAFGDPCEALEWLKGARPDLIVTDHDMPQIDGDEFISRFRALPHSAGVPIMMITVNDQRTLRLRALESGATDFLTTPIDHFEFLSRARNLLKLSQAGTPARRETREGGRKKGADDFAIETRKLLARCGEAAAYALHVLEIDIAEGAHFDLNGLVAALRRQQNETDMLGRIDHLRFLVLQGDVVDAAEAEACARRLAALAPVGARFRVGTALPREDCATPEMRAVKCLREALAKAAAGKDALFEKSRWRFLPRIDLHSGAICGAQFLRGEEPAEAGDAEALQAAMASANAFRAANRPLRLSLRLRLNSGFPGTDAASLLSRSRMPPDWLELQLCARDALSQPQRAEQVARSFRSLGVGLALDLGDLASPGVSGREEDFSVREIAPLETFARAFRPAILFSCGARSRPASIARFFRAASVRRMGRAPILVAANVASPTLLTPLRRAGVTAAQGPCFGAPFASRDMKMLASAWTGEGPSPCLAQGA
jgi:CheY-like chemotaxis protein